MSSSSSSLRHDEATHSASSSTRVSVQAVSPATNEEPSAGALGPTPLALLQPSSIKDYDTRHTTKSSSVKHVPIVRSQTLSITESDTESERERLERERAIEAVSPHGELLMSLEDEKEARQEKEDPFLVVWDANDKENPHVCPIKLKLLNVCAFSDPRAS